MKKRMDDRRCGYLGCLDSVLDLKRVKRQICICILSGSGTLIEALKSVFPNIQFIIATHSPIIISSCKDVNLVLVDHNQEVIYLDDAYGYSVNEVLELRQGSSDVLKSVKDMKNEFDFAINKDDLQKASKIVEEMAQEFGDDNTEVVKARTELEMEDFLGDED